MHEREQPQEVILRKAGDIRERFQIEILRIVRVDEIGGDRDAPIDLATGRSTDELQLLDLQQRSITELPHALEQEVQLFLIPPFILQTLSHMRLDEAQHRRDEPVMRLQVLAEFDRPLRQPRAVGERLGQRDRHRGVSGLGQSGTKADRQRFHRVFRSNTRGVHSSLIQDQKRVVIDTYGPPANVAMLGSAPRGSNRQWLRVRDKVGAQYPSPDDAVFMTPLRRH